MPWRPEVRVKLELYDPASDSQSDGLGAIACAEFFHDVLDMPFHRFFRDEKQRCDVAIAIPPCDLLKNFDLSLAQRFISNMLAQLNRDLWRDLSLPRMHLADHINELFPGHAFEHVTLRSRLQRTLNLGVSFKRR